MSFISALFLYFFTGPSLYVIILTENYLPLCFTKVCLVSYRLCKQFHSNNYSQVTSVLKVEERYGKKSILFAYNAVVDEPIE